ncbi:hypothetical protein B4U79_15142 [Dinothrombium tinctorium]|uniref:Uncharacterized protein n=1 Tax=Dinothrombium tinctorium TaxID=1965070 RepID=A0A443RI17_9ACAR|nr:hypothetical protein B4U79_14226 [Dinothrombium tinctorium]RWS16553.1 hypothetical protein B4U79_15142 [Dinothrombium tinctorium]
MWKLAPVFLEAAAIRQGNFQGTRQGSNPTLYDSHGNPFHFSTTNASHLQPSAAVQQSPLTDCIWTFFWLGILIFIGYPIGLCACELYVIFSPFCVLCPKLESFANFLFKISQLPSLCTRNMINAKAIITM